MAHQSTRSPSTADLTAFIGIDVGGTHTDVAVSSGDRLVRGKALTTYDDFSRGVLAAIEVAAGTLGVGLHDLLAGTKMLINGTTVVTNIITQLRGAKVGVLITEGFRDVFRIAGGPRLNVADDHLQTNVPDLVDRRTIKEITQRTNYAGDDIVALDEHRVREATRELVEVHGVDSIAVCYLNSHVSGDHELRTEQLIHDLYPELFVTPAHRVFPVRGETRRFTTAVLNCFVHDQTRAYINSIDTKLTEAGLPQPPVFFQGLGGAISKDRAVAHPLALLGSGPAGGALGANELGKRLGYQKILLGDMGGTSFDTGIINDNEVHTQKNIEIGQLQTGVNVVDVVSVGAGGGSIAWVSQRGLPQVGPDSAGSHPGPAAYGLGGQEPTVTDAMTVMGYIDPENYLGGRMHLDTGAAETALQDKFAKHFDWSVDRAAAAVHDLVVVNMAHAVREVSVGKGYDPRNFTFLAYGGTLPLFASQIADRLKIPKVVIPQNSSVFSGLGLLSSDFVLRKDQTVDWKLNKPEEVGRVNEAADRLLAEALAEMRAEGFADEDIEVAHSADFRFEGQVYELTMPVPNRHLTKDDTESLAEGFYALYERVYGVGAAFAGVPEVLLNYTITVTGHQPRPALPELKESPTPLSEVRKGEREVYIPMTQTRQKIPTYDGAKFTPGTTIIGPAIIDENDTTIFAPPGTTVSRDRFNSYVMTREDD
ncbi:hydantoinase/oxoprolinase family protein [Sciscionella marina]|uniref:hydantoinase/oxoprolinase family protein n=1 Tax=Sciscionella marina TaxID=508770 RepID=UPI00036DF46E|nr:hydantoinase/oxoprolinase family protein [Sciscionella marina]